MGKSTFDRRGFQSLMHVLLCMIPISLIVLVIFFHRWWIGLGMFLVSCVSFITLEAVTARPDNNPHSYLRWKRTTDGQRPVLLCLGDSLLHGNIGASITPEIPFKLTLRMGLPPAKYGATFTDPLWVVNAGQNNITSHTVLHERLSFSMNVQPDFICIMIGTNDILAMHNAVLGMHLSSINHLPVPPTMEVLERNLTQIVEFIQESSPMTRVGLCTLPPMGEDLRSRANDLVRKANQVIEGVVKKAGGRLSVVPVFDHLESILEKDRRGWTPPVDMFLPIAVIQNLLFHLTPIKSWSFLAKPFGFRVLSDGLHLNERGRDAVVDSIIDWLVEANITKAIAVKSR